MEKFITLRRAIKVNMDTLKSPEAPICATTNEAFKEAPTCIFIEKALDMGLSPKDIMIELYIDMDTYNKMVLVGLENQNNPRYKLKKNLVTNYLKYHG